MWLPFSVLLGALATLGQAEINSRDTIAVVWDCIVVGGGPGGLSALSALARVRRNTLLIDSGVYRNGPTRHMHDVLGFDGMS